LDVVAVALDIEGMEKAGHYYERAHSTHPALIDAGHALDRLFGVVNVPSGIWIDEDGVIVRPPEPAWPGRAVFAELPVPENIDGYARQLLGEARRIRHNPERYLAALRDWVSHGGDSRFALAPQEVVDRSRPRSLEVSAAAAHFELGQHLHREGRIQEAQTHFRQAHRLQPANWTYRRQAWSLLDPLQGPSEVYGSDWVTDVRAVGAENYYELADL
jgi:tetratricopeptide (TPR) repeat protein